MKFNKSKLVTYQIKLELDDSDDLLYGIALQVKAFIDGVGQKIDKEGYKCDEYDLLYMPYYDSRIVLWFNLYPNNRGVLIVGVPTRIVKTIKPKAIQETIEEALKD